MTAMDSTDYKLAAMEATFVYHLVKEGQSYQSANCGSELVRSVYGSNPKFTCAATKTESIVSGYFYFLFPVYV